MQKGQFFLSVLLLLISISSCKNGEDDGNLPSDLIENPNTANGNVNSNQLPKFEFKYTEHDFGKIVDGVKVSFTFKFKNVGNSDLIINQVKTSCGCTASTFTKTTVKPGEFGLIKLTFDSSHRKGYNNKVATVVANTQPNTQILKITSMVVGPEEL